MTAAPLCSECLNYIDGPDAHGTDCSRAGRHRLEVFRIELIITVPAGDLPTVKRALDDALEPWSVSLGAPVRLYAEWRDD